MIERELDIATQDGAMNTYTVRPDDGGPLPVVLMLMDAPGVREALREICRRIAQSGYYVLLPNLFYRTTREFVLGPTRDLTPRPTSRTCSPWWPRSPTTRSQSMSASFSTGCRRWLTPSRARSGWSATA
jgi:dienelactone hydrolase